MQKEIVDKASTLITRISNSINDIVINKDIFIIKTLYFQVFKKEN